MNETTRIVLTFGGDGDKDIRINLPRGNKDLLAATATETMERMIALGVILTKDGKPVSVGSVEIRTTEVQAVA
jgi:hypothetical protein